MRKMDICKTQQTQYVETDEHPFQSKQISHSGVVSFGHDEQFIYERHMIGDKI